MNNSIAINERLERLDLPPQTKLALSALYKMHPKLEAIPVILCDTKHAAFYHHGSTSPGDLPFVGVSTDWRETIIQRGLNSPDAQPLREIIKNNLGVTTITPEFLITYVILHEYGHASHYFGWSNPEIAAFNLKWDGDFKADHGAANLAEFDINFPNATPEERSEFARAYRNRVKEQRADSLACELLQQLAEDQPGLFPEITNFVKNYP